MRANWITPAIPLKTTRSSTTTCPDNWVELVMITPRPIWQLWPACEYASM